MLTKHLLAPSIPQKPPTTNLIIDTPLETFRTTELLNFDPADKLLQPEVPRIRQVTLSPVHPPAEPESTT